MIKLKTVISEVSKDYLDIQGVQQKAKVVLSINYEKSTFNIIPGGCTDGKFLFTNNPAKANMWIAVAELIIEATEFAKKELGI